MKKIKRKKKNRRTGYTPVTTSSKSRGPKKHAFHSKGQNERVNQKGMDIEKSSVTQKNILFGLFLLAGFGLMLLGVSDNGMKISFLGIQYSGSLVGLVVAVLAGVGIVKNRPNIDIEDR